MDYNSLPGSFIHGILQVRILDWVAMAFSRGCSPAKGGTQVSSIADGFSTIWAMREAQIKSSHSLGLGTVYTFLKGCGGVRGGRDRDLTHKA